MRNSVSESKVKLLRQNVQLVKHLHPGLRREDFAALRGLTKALHLSIVKGELLFIDGKWYVTHAGLLQIALRRRCLGIRTSLQERFSDANMSRWVFRATVYRSPRSKGFVGYGDADPSNVSSLVHGAEMRVAETRAVNRALRKAYGIGLCSVEELGWVSKFPAAEQSSKNGPCATSNIGHSGGQARLRDRLCLLIRQHRLDASLVKAYAADYCGKTLLRDATRDQVEAFINHLAERATKDRESLLCHLNSYSRREEVTI